MATTKVVKVVTGGICPKKTNRAEEEIRQKTGEKNVRFVHTHKRNLTADSLRDELSRGGPAEKLIIIGCSQNVTQKILNIIGKKPEIVMVAKINELTQAKTA